MKFKIVSKVIFLASTIVLSLSVLADPVWIDVRSENEYKESHIDGDVLIPHENIVSGVTKMFPAKDADIRLYCRSGRRAGIAKKALEEEGYTNVTNEGGIDDAREKREL